MLSRLRIIAWTLSSSSSSSSSCSRRSFATIMNDSVEEIFAKKRFLRTQIIKQLRNMSADQKADEDNVIQKIVLEAPWCKSTNSLCAYVSCDALREVDTLKILSEVLCNNARVMQANEPVDLFIWELKSSSVMFHLFNLLYFLPGLPFDKSGGRSGGYYDMYLKKYLEVAKERKWKPPLLVALSYSIQIVDEGAVPVTSLDVPVDALVSPASVISTSASVSAGKFISFYS